MTLKEKVAEIMPEMIGEKFPGGVKTCPMYYDFLKGHYEAKAENGCLNQYKCEKCWNMEYIEDAEKTPDQNSNSVNHPAHYQGKHECIDIMRVLFGDEAVKGFCKCNAFKYRFRAGRKEENTAEQDILKAEWYEDYLFKMENEP